MERITVKTSQNYDILLGKGLINEVAELISPFCATRRVLIITDDIVDLRYGDLVLKNLKNSGYFAEKFVFANGEGSKNIDTLSNILEFAAENRFKRNDLFLALGGGVVGDVGGLAAALYMRGVSVIQIPTTLLSAVDSSIGGKTAVDLKAGKNLCGVFKQPEFVIVDTNIIKDLPDDIFLSGMGEVIKCNIIKDLGIFDYIENDCVKENIETIIYDCLNLKRDIVEKDEFDTKGLRNLLNVGHTIAHAIEHLSDYTVLHGNSVALGTVIEARIARKLGICDEDTLKSIENAVSRAGLYFEPPYGKEAIAKSCILDKKNRDNRIVFLLPERLGSCREVKISADELIALL